MIEKITIENYKSVQQLEIELGRVTVLIGANGSGKSNILEAIALSSAAANNKLDNEFLVSRGVRITDDPQFMRAAFDSENTSKEIIIKVEGGRNNKFDFILQKNNEQPYSLWLDKGKKSLRLDMGKNSLGAQEIIEHLNKLISENKMRPDEFVRTEHILPIFEDRYDELKIKDFLIYSPENSSLRSFEQEWQIQPLGTKGEGLFKLLKVLSSGKNKKRLDEVKSKLKLIDWFSDFDVAKDLAPQEKRIQIKDKYLDKNLEYFDQKSSNEGFLFLLFYFCLFISSDTPNFFAIDNIDASLNPKLCSQLMIELTALAKKHKKQVIFTTHNPAVLDGLNLNDANQKLYVVYRNKLGHTKVDNVKKPQPINGKEPVKLSEAFLRGYLGGLPNNF